MDLSRVDRKLANGLRQRGLVASSSEIHRYIRILLGITRGPILRWLGVKTRTPKRVAVSERRFDEVSFRGGRRAIWNGEADYSPDGKTIAYAATYDDPDNYYPAQIYTIPSSGGAPTRITNFSDDPSSSTDLITSNVTYSPDGKWVAYAVYDSALGRGQIYKVPSSGGDPTLIANVPRYINHLDWGSEGVPGPNRH
jgi:Tol biopolymer transport system component